MTSDEAKKAAKDIAESASDASARVGASAKDVYEKSTTHVRDFAARANDAVGDIYDQAQDRIRDGVERFPGHVSQAADVGRRAYDRSSDVVGRRVSKQPIEALVLAGAIGYLIGWATNRS